MVDVFISYSRDNRDRVAEIAKAVAAAGYDIWWDAELPPHKSYGDVITEKIGSAKAAIVVWSHASAQSEWVRAEADVARNQKKLVQTAIDDVMPPLPFNQIQFAELADWHGEADHRGWRKVLMSLEELCGPASAPVSAPAPTPVPSQRVAAEPEQHGRRASSLPWILAGIAIIVAALFAWQFSQSSRAPEVVAAPIEATEVVDPVAPREAFVLAAVINDPEGFTNIRIEPSSRSTIVGKAVDGEKFLTYQQSGRWWRVRKGDGTMGYMYRKLIRVLDGPNPDPVPLAVPEPALPVNPGAAGGGGRMIFGDSSDRSLTSADIAGLGRGELRIARNEIYARRGLRFNDPALHTYFSQFSWYRPTLDTIRLSGIEQANVALLKAAEASAQ